MKEREFEKASPTKDVHFKIFKNVEREKLEQQRQLDHDFPGEHGSDEYKIWQHFNIISPALATVKPEVSPVKDSPVESPDVGNIVLKQREDSKRSESPAVAKPGQAAARRDSVGDKARAAAQPRLKQPLKLVDENQVLHWYWSRCTVLYCTVEVFCDGITEFLTDNTDFIVVGVLGLQNAGKSSILNSLVRPGGEKEELFRVQNYEHQASYATGVTASEGNSMSG